jgi:Na+:H+ antiporter, NhaA family
VRIGDAFGICCRPEGASWPQIYGASVLCGIGFTMSLFVGAIAFPDQPEAVDSAKIGTLAGSLLAAVMGWAVLRATSPVPWIDDQVEQSLRLFGFAHSEEPRREVGGAAAEDCGCESEGEGEDLTNGRRSA